MPNTRSAKKRVRQTEKKSLRNKAVKSKIRTLGKRLAASLASGEIENARIRFRQLESELHSAVSKKILPKNAAARKISRLEKKLQAATPQAS